MNKEEKIALIKKETKKMIKLIKEDKHIDVEVKPISEAQRDFYNPEVLKTKKIGEIFSIIYKK